MYKRNRRSKSNKMPSINASDSMSGLSDPFFLEFGSSVSVSEDLYREIYKECRILEDSTQKTKNQIKSESRTKAQLQIDNAHATVEMKTLLRNAAEEVDSAKMNQDTRNQLVEQFNLGLVELLRPRKKYLAQDTNEDIDEKSQPLAHFIEKATKEFEQMSADSKQLYEEIGKVAAERLKAEDELKALNHRLAPDSELNQKQLEALNERDDRQRELDAEQHRLKCLKAACHRSRTRCTEYVTELVRQDEDFAIKQKEYRQKEEEVDIEIAEMEKEISLVEKGEISELKNQLEELLSEIELIEHQHTQLENMETKQTNLKQECDQMAKEEIEIEADHKRLMDDLEAAKKNLAKSESSLKLTKEEEAKILELQELNDKRERIRPLQTILAEIENHTKQGEKIAEQTIELHSLYKQAETRFAGKRQQLNEQISELEGETKVLHENATSIAKEREALEIKEKDLLSAMDLESESLKLTATKLREATEVQKKKAQEILEGKEAEKQARLELAKEDSLLELSKEQIKVKLLTECAKLLQETEQQIHQLNEPFDESLLESNSIADADRKSRDETG